MGLRDTWEKQKKGVSLEPTAMLQYAGWCWNARSKMLEEGSRLISRIWGWMFHRSQELTTSVARSCIYWAFFLLFLKWPHNTITELEFIDRGTGSWSPRYLKGVTMYTGWKKMGQWIILSNFLSFFNINFCILINTYDLLYTNYFCTHRIEQLFSW